MLKEQVTGTLNRLTAVVGVHMKFPTYPPNVQDEVLASSDPVRLSSIALALKTIDREGINGSVAECGVYRGELSVFLSQNIGTRNLFLFDTFQGFDSRDHEGDNRFRDTSLQSVAFKVPSAILKPGYFPDTAIGLESETFAFVMLDFDLYQPTLAGLNFFYPRMSRGGYIFLHDYNSPESEYAISKAAREFLKDKPELLIEIPDRWGSAALRKI